MGWDGWGHCIEFSRWWFEFYTPKLLLFSIIINTYIFSRWVFPKIGVPQNGWFIMENPIKMGWFRGKTHYFRKHPGTLDRLQHPKSSIWLSKVSVGTKITWLWDTPKLRISSWMPRRLLHVFFRYISGIFPIHVHFLTWTATLLFLFPQLWNVTSFKELGVWKGNSNNNLYCIYL